MREEIDALRVMGLESDRGADRAARARADHRRCRSWRSSRRWRDVRGGPRRLDSMATSRPTCSWRGSNPRSTSRRFGRPHQGPVHGLVIGVIASIEGMAVEGSAESLGRQRHVSVVKSIFMVIVRRRPLRHLLRSGPTIDARLPRPTRTIATERARTDHRRPRASKSGFGERLVMQEASTSISMRGESARFRRTPRAPEKSVLTRTILGLAAQTRRHRIEVNGRGLRQDHPEESANSLERRWGVLFQQGALFSAI